MTMIFTSILFISVLFPIQGFTFLFSCLENEIFQLKGEEWSTSSFSIQTSTEKSTFNLFTNQFSSFKSNEQDLSSSSSSLTELSTMSNEIFDQQEQWINLNQSDLFWKKVQGNGSSSLTYDLQNRGQCLRQMCFVRLQYNGLLRKGKDDDGCLTFLLWTRGQPIGQIWIEEDDEEERFSQKIQLTNSTIRVEHSFKSNIKSLSIHSRIFFSNPRLDGITLSNLNIHFNGSCPKHQSKIISEDEQTTTIINESTQSTNEIDSSSIEDETSERSVTSTMKFNANQSMNISQLKSDRNQLKIIWMISLITFICLLMIFTSIIYGIWTISSHYRFIWYIPYEYPIQFLSRRSVSSSTDRLETLEEICNDLNEKSLDILTIDSHFSDLHSYF